MNGLLIFVVGGVTFKAIQTVRYFNKQKELYDEVEVESIEEK